MTLSERLAAAAEARARGQVHLTRRGPAVDLDQTPAGTDLEGSAVSHKRVIASASTPVMAVTPDPLAPADAICPTCGRTGEQGMVDLAGRTVDWSCLACGTLWQVRLP